MINLFCFFLSGVKLLFSLEKMRIFWVTQKKESKNFKKAFLVEEEKRIFAAVLKIKFC
jgi:hypothetical protein